MTRRWRDFANLVLGAWLCVSPWVIGYPREAAAWNACVLGAATIVAFGFAVFTPKVWVEVLGALFGVWLIVSPFVLNFAFNSAIAVNTVVVGALIVDFACWAICSDSKAVVQLPARR